MHLHSAFSEAAPSGEAADVRGAPGRRRAWSQVGKGVAAFLAGILIGASTIIIAELAAPQQDGPAPYEQGPVELRH